MSRAKTLIGRTFVWHTYDQTEDGVSGFLPVGAPVSFSPVLDGRMVMHDAFEHGPVLAGNLDASEAIADEVRAFGTIIAGRCLTDWYYSFDYRANDSSDNVISVIREIAYEVNNAREYEQLEDDEPFVAYPPIKRRSASIRAALLKHPDVMDEDHAAIVEANIHNELMLTLDAADYDAVIANLIVGIDRLTAFANKYGSFVWCNSLHAVKTEFDGMFSSSAGGALSLATILDDLVYRGHSVTLRARIRVSTDTYVATRPYGEIVLRSRFNGRTYNPLEMAGL